ncbi:hypothetical protein [Nonomuraea diastatica]|uniref:hypothetical protein n=1 Tax=Nonomuraea diastatica TaxID=1848329 RepID=UPI00140B7B74|nr:hypothetical protein [Nonomuraea diastatica]
MAEKQWSHVRAVFAVGGDTGTLPRVQPLHLAPGLFLAQALDRELPLHMSDTR